MSAARGLVLISLCVARVTLAAGAEEVGGYGLDAALAATTAGVAGDPLLAAGDLPGVGRTPLGSGALVLRGANPGDAASLVAGIEVPTLYHFGGVRGVLPVAMLSGVDLHLGEAGAAYGRMAAGALEVRPRALAPAQTETTIDLSLMDTGLFVALPTGPQTAVAIGVRRSHLEPLLAVAVGDVDGITLTKSPRYYDYQLLANGGGVLGGALSLFVFGADDAASVTFANPADFSPAASGARLSFRQSFYRAVVLHHVDRGAALQNDLRLATGRDRTRAAMGDDRYDQDVLSTQVQEALRFAFNDRLDITVGADWLLQVNDLQLRMPRPRLEGEPAGAPGLGPRIALDLADQIETSPAMFVSLEARPFEGLAVFPGLRVDWLSRLAEATFEPRVFIRRRFAAGLGATASLGVFHREPSLEQTDARVGNPQLETGRAVHYTVGGFWRPLPFLMFDARGFYGVLDRLVTRTDAMAVDSDGAAPRRYDNHGRGRMVGLELSARHETHAGVSGFVSYTLSRSTRRDDIASAYRPFDGDQTHVVSAAFSYALPRDFGVAVRCRYASGRPTTPVVGVVFNADTDQYDPTYGKPNSARLAPAHRLDVRVDKRWHDGEQRFSVFVELHNVSSHRDPEGLQYDYGVGESRPQRGLPLLPFFGVEASL